MSGFDVPMSPLASTFGDKTAKDQWVKKRVAVFGDGTGQDNDAQVYYENLVTGETRWDPPMELEMDDSLQGQSLAPPAADMTAPFDVSTPEGRRDMVRRLALCVHSRVEAGRALEGVVEVVGSGGTEEDWKEAGSMEGCALLRLLARALVLEDKGEARLGVRCLVMLARAWGGSWAALLSMSQSPMEVVGARPPESHFNATSAVDGVWGNWEGFLLERGGSALRDMATQREREEDRMVWLTALVDVMTCVGEGEGEGKKGAAFDWRKFGRGRVHGLVGAIMGLLAGADAEEYALACGVLLVLNAHLVPAGEDEAKLNVVMQCCVAHASGGALLESLLHEFNEASSEAVARGQGGEEEGEQGLEGMRHRWLLKFWVDVFEHFADGQGLVHANDVRVMVDILLRSLQSFRGDSPLLPDYLALLSVVLTKSTWAHPQEDGSSDEGGMGKGAQGYLRDELVELLQGLARGGEGEHGAAAAFLADSILNDIR